MKNGLVTQTDQVLSHTLGSIYSLQFSSSFLMETLKNCSNAQDVNTDTLWKNQEAWEMCKEKDTKNDP